MFALFDCCVAKVSVFSTFPYRVSLTIFEYEDTQGDPWHLNVEQMRCPETSQTNKPTLHRNPKGRRSRPYRGDSLKFRTSSELD
jgi:hypothetical protein